MPISLNHLRRARSKCDRSPAIFNRLKRSLRFCPKTALEWFTSAALDGK
ncbi:MAG TPA: hypothetical protein V6D14_01565 [Coleofasciculaceae cyanobacterium]